MSSSPGVEPSRSESDRCILYLFAISHYCERARWALDYLDIDYTLEHLAPGSHIEQMKRLGAPGSSVPVLTSKGRVVQGSAAILDWADAETSDVVKRLRPDPGFEDECHALEARLDDVAGVHVRRYYYSEALVDHPETEFPILAQGLPDSEFATFEQNWDLVQKLMIARMDLGTEQGQESRHIVEGELDRLDERLRDGRHFLLGDRFSRADITAASLFAPLAVPKKHPTYGTLAVPPRARADLALWADRPSIQWVRETYAAYR